MVMRTVQRVSVTIYCVLIGYLHCNEVGRLVLNTRIPVETGQSSPCQILLGIRCRDMAIFLSNMAAVRHVG